MNKMYLQILYQVKKKEGKVIDLSLLAEEEKLALLELYKTAYEKSFSDGTDSSSQQIEESENIVETLTQEDDETALSNNIMIAPENNDELSEDNTVLLEEDEQIDITYEDADEEDESAEETTSERDEERYRYIAENTVKLEDVQGNNDASQKGSFEYSSFTPYKPKFDDMELNNNIFSTDDSMGGIKVDMSASTNVEKYEMKSKNKNKSNFKTSKDGRYKIADSYSVSKEKVEIPFLKIITIVFSVLALGVFVTQFVYHYDEAVLKSYCNDFVFGLATLAIFMSTMNNSLLSFKGVTFFIALCVDFFVIGIEAYKDGLYRILNPELENDFIYGLVMLLTLFAKYIFILLCGIYSMKKKDVLHNVINILGIILCITIIVFIGLSSKCNELVWYYDKIPENAGLLLFVISAVFSNNLYLKR